MFGLLYSVSAFLTQQLGEWAGLALTQTGARRQRFLLFPPGHE